LGEAAPGADVVGIATPAGNWGNAGNIKLRFTDEYTRLAAANQL
jgi:NitT/TauT family transport system substrate-binding protein